MIQRRPRRSGLASVLLAVLVLVWLALVVAGLTLTAISLLSGS